METYLKEEKKQLQNTSNTFLEGCNQTTKIIEQNQVLGWSMPAVVHTPAHTYSQHAGSLAHFEDNFTPSLFVRAAFLSLHFTD